VEVAVDSLVISSVVFTTLGLLFLARYAELDKKARRERCFFTIGVGIGVLAFWFFGGVGLLIIAFWLFLFRILAI
jgi:hypothetical protein